MSSNGYMSMYKPPRVAARAEVGLAAAAAAKDPYGLHSRSGPPTFGPAGGFAAPPRPVTAPRPTSPTVSATDPRVTASLAANPYAAGSNGSLFTGNLNGPPKASDVNTYDLSTDPALQQIQSLVGMSDQNAQSSALKQRQNLLLAYGDPSVAKSVLGENDPMIGAIGQNPTSTVHQLGQQRDRNLQSLEEALNQANLGYSGYRITQESQAGQDYQNALAQAAAALNTNLDSVSGNLDSVLAANNATRAQGISDAAARAQASAAASGTDPGATTPPPSDGTSTSAPDPGFVNSGGYGDVPIIPLTGAEQQALTSNVYTPGLQSDPTDRLATAAVRNDVFEPSVGAGPSPVATPWSAPPLPAAEQNALQANTHSPGSIIDNAVSPPNPPVVPGPASVTTNDALLQLLAQLSRGGQIVR